MSKKAKKKGKVASSTPVNTASTESISFWKSQMIPAAILFFVAMGLYSSTISYEYVLDDALVFTKHNDVKKGFSGIPDLLSKESFAGYFGEQKNLVVGARYRPLSLITFAMEFQFTQHEELNEDGQPVLMPNPKVSHFINILLYGLTALLLFRVMAQWFPIKKDSPPFWNMAFIISLLYVIHPIHSEVVANVKGRDEILAFIGSLAVCYYSWKYFVKGKAVHLVISAVIMMLALLAKENALTFLAIVPLIGYFFNKANKQRILMITAVLFVTSLLYLTFRSNIIGYFLSSGKEITDIMNNPFAGLNFEEKFATIFYTLGLYLKLLVFPHPLTHDYYPYHIPIMHFSNWQVLLALTANIGLGLASIWGMFKKKTWAFGILFYFITFSIVSNIPFTVGTFMNERFVYISSLGFCITLSWILLNWLPVKIKSNSKLIGQAIVGLFAIGFLVKAITRIPDWESPMTLNSAAIKVSPNSARANTFYGTALFSQYKNENDQTKKYDLLEKVTFHIDKAIEINPKYFSAMTMKAGIIAEHHKKDRDDKKCLDAFHEVIKRKPNINFVDTYVDYMSTRADKELIIDFAIKTGELFIPKRDFNNAARFLNIGLKVYPNDPRMRRAMGLMYQAAGDRRAAQFLN